MASKEGKNVMKISKLGPSVVLGALGCLIGGSALAGDGVHLPGRVATVDPPAEICFGRYNEWISKPASPPAACTGAGAYAMTPVSVALPTDPLDSNSYSIDLRMYSNSNTACRLFESNPINGAFVQLDYATGTGGTPHDEQIALSGWTNFNAANRTYSVECQLNPGTFLRSVKVWRY
jgi:hypothetical protein